jgi:hypothetical protein
VRKRISDSSDPAKADLPDYSADWQLPGPKASNAEIVARFYYEFARESQTILMLTERLCHFSRGEILRAQLQALNYPGSPVEVLHPMCAGIMYALTPAINLREVSWNQLEPEQKRVLTNESALGGAFRQLDFGELFNFAHELIYPTERKSTTPEYENIRPRWYRSSRLYYGGIEEVAIHIDWSQGPQAVKAAMEQWLLRHKRELLQLKSEGKLPGYKHGSYMFRFRNETGAGNPRRKYLTALRGLGAMRLLGNHTLVEAIRITQNPATKRSLFWGFIDPDTQQPLGRSAWNHGIKKARQTFQELFYRQDEYLLRIRRSGGLPEKEEPISYQRLLLRRQNR